MITSLLLLLLPIAAASGWIAARHASTTPKNPPNNQCLAQDYLVGLNYLLNEQPDKAVDAFIKMLEVDSETVETHLALGTLFRRKGEVDRAIRIHQNLIARPQLTVHQRLEALLALGQDYLKAGFLDRAERLFLEVSDANNEQYKTSALSHLLDIYQQQKRWEAAIAIGNHLVANQPEIQSNIAHYYCELATSARAQEQNQQAREYLTQAQKADPNCARANLLLGALEFDEDNLQASLDIYQAVKSQDGDFFSEALVPIITCFEQLGKTTEILAYFKDCVHEQPRIPIILALVELIKIQEDTTAAIDFLTKQLRKKPSVHGLHRLIVLHLETTSDRSKDNLLTVHEAVLRLLRDKLDYHCDNCGFASKILHWLCPGCKRWGSVKPVEN